MRSNDEVDAEIDYVLGCTQDQLGTIEQRVRVLASVISGGANDYR